MTKAIKTVIVKHFQTKLDEAAFDSKKIRLFCIHCLTGNLALMHCPTEYLHYKISKIRQRTSLKIPPDTVEVGGGGGVPITSESPFTIFSCFEPRSRDQIRKTHFECKNLRLRQSIRPHPSSFLSLLMFSRLSLKASLNFSPLSGAVPCNMSTAWPGVSGHYRPMSNLPHVSKLLERAVACVCVRVYQYGYVCVGVGVRVCVCMCVFKNLMGCTCSYAVIWCA